MTHLEEAQTAAEALSKIPPHHAAFNGIALDGILHALLALHEQAEPKPTARAPRTSKESK